MCLTDDGWIEPLWNFVSLEDALSETIPCGGMSDFSTATRWVVPILSGCSSLPPFTSSPQQQQHDMLLCLSRRQQQHTTTTMKQPIRNTRSPITMFNMFSLVAPVAGVGIAAVFVVTFVVVVFIENWFNKVACGKETDNLMFLPSRYESWYDPFSLIYLYLKLRPSSASVRFRSVMITLPWRNMISRI